MSLDTRNYFSHPITEKEMRETYYQAYGKEYDCPSRKQFPLPIEIAYIVAVEKLRNDSQTQLTPSIHI